MHLANHGTSPACQATGWLELARLGKASDLVGIHQLGTIRVNTLLRAVGLELDWP